MTMTRFVRTVAASAFVALGAIALGAQAPAPEPQTSVQRLALTAGRSVVLTTGFDITRVAITDPAIADATVVAPTEILVDGKSAGTVSLIVWGAAQRSQYDVVVDRGVSPLQQQLQLIFPGEDLQASQTTAAVILTGHASNNNVMLRAGEIAAAMAPESKVLNMLELPGGSESQQVMLQVRVAEVNRRALTELGASLFTGATGYKNVLARSTTQQFSAPDFDNLDRTAVDGQLAGAEGEITFSDFLNLFLFSNKYNVGALIKALQTSGNFQSLAEPNLIAYNGKEATFLAGGELPIPVVQGATGTVTVQFKEFGVRLGFLPIIAGDVIRLQVTPEVSSLDFSNGISLGGFRIPAIITRRASTEVELRDGQSFAIAGLMNNASQDTKQAVPLLSKLPIIGAFFKSKATNQERTEIMVIVTPRLVRALNPDEVPPLPTMDEEFLTPGEAGPNGSGPGPGR
jgi:pilus assembly protein CpaC